MHISDTGKNRLIYVFIALVAAVGSFLFWSLDGPSRPEENEAARSTENIDQAQNAPLTPAASSAEEGIVLPEIEISLEPAAEVRQEKGLVVQEVINLAVPFTSQAPLYEWKDQRQQDGCEEASVLMAMAWVKGEAGLTPAEWKERIVALADWEQEKYGEHRDVSVPDTVDWMFKDYFSYDNVRSENITGVDQLVEVLEAGSILLVPVNGQALGNPNFTAPGPEHHFVIIKGYDYAAQEFITNDPGTRLGKDYRYPEEVIYEALRAYPTGYHDHYDEIRKQAIVVEK